MLKIRATKNTLIVLSCIAALILFGCIGMCIRGSSNLQAMEAQVKEKQDLLANSKRTARMLEDVEREYADSQMKLSALEKGVSTKAFVPTLLRQLEDLGRTSHLRVVGVRPKPAVEAPKTAAAPGPDGKPAAQAVAKPEPYDKLDVDVEVTGKYWDVVGFLKKLTAFPKIVAVSGIQVSPLPDGKKAGSPQLSVKLSVTTFILKTNMVKESPGVGTTQSAGSGRV